MQQPTIAMRHDRLALGGLDNGPANQRRLLKGEKRRAIASSHLLPKQADHRVSSSPYQDAAARGTRQGAATVEHDNVLSHVKSPVRPAEWQPMQSSF